MSATSTKSTLATTLTGPAPLVLTPTSGGWSTAEDNAIREACERGIHPLTAARNRHPGALASACASTLNATYHRDPNTYAVRNVRQGASVLARAKALGLTWNLAER